MPHVKYVLDTDVSGTFFLDNADGMRVFSLLVKNEGSAIDEIECKSPQITV